jgi:hypothetical protein
MERKYKKMIKGRNLLFGLFRTADLFRRSSEKKNPAIE